MSLFSGAIEEVQKCIRHRTLNSAGPKLMLTKSCFRRKHLRSSRTQNVRCASHALAFSNLLGAEKTAFLNTY